MAAIHSNPITNGPTDDQEPQSVRRLRNGLNAAEIKERFVAFGPNELPETERRSFLRTMGGVFAEPMFLLLAAAAAIYLIIGDLVEGVVLAGFAALSIFLVVIQERRSEKALDALRALGAPRARVIRDGAETHIPARQIVPGDMLLVSEGERIAADAIVRRAQELTLDESLLTGEGAPV